VLPAYPQYSGTTTASIFDAVFEHYGVVRNIPELRLCATITTTTPISRRCANRCSTTGIARSPDKLVMSFHGVPKRTLLLGDPYHCECLKTRACWRIR
jgi:ferrochelatase